MKKSLLLWLFISSTLTIYAQEEWKAVSGKILTPWASEVNSANPLPEYPRPQMVRDQWQNLNGMWSYTVQSKGEGLPSRYEGKILVPFAIESALSGVGKNVGEDKELWYSTRFTLPKNQRKGKVLLHFGAVDWEAEVFVNGKSVGSHRGGYDPFTFNISEFLTAGKQQELTVRVWDPTDKGPQPRGKQIKNPHGIWYTPVTGIWQTVWLETVPTNYIESLRNTADIDKASLTVRAKVSQEGKDQKIKLKVFKEGELVAEREAPVGEDAVVTLDDPLLWSPDQPFLYDLEVALLKGNKTLDQVKSYAAMRKISRGADAQGIQRLLLNNEFLFQYGPLDQGWWPDGLYTAPTDEALLFDIQETKNMGFNMIRKHVKVEPARWYYHADRLGLLVWQDMPSGDMGNHWESRPGVVGRGTEKDRSPESEAIFKTEWKAIMDANYNFASIVVWVPFNEAWGQFKTKEIVEWTEEYDPSRLVNGASGGNFSPDGDIIDMHNYPDPVMPDPALYGKERVIVLGEFGGLGLPVEGHTWQEKDNWGYQSFSTREELSKRYSQLIHDLEKLIPEGLSAAVYTQTTDVEVEVNGLMTYDRKLIKIDPDQLKQLHQLLYHVKIPLK